MNLSVLSAQHVSIGYASGKSKKHVLASDVDFVLAKGQLMALLGPNGAGKSTLLRTLAGLHPMLGGDILINDVSIRRLTPAQLATLVSVVLTEKSIPSGMTVGMLVGLGRTPYLGWLGKLDKNDHEIVCKSLAQVGMEALHHARLDELSDGQRQKALIARALAQDTPLIILDEPTAFLDVANRRKITALLANLAHDGQKSIIMSTHEPELAIAHADHILTLSLEGKTEIHHPNSPAMYDVLAGLFGLEKW